MLPDRCSVKHSGRDCVNPPEYVVEIVHNEDSYMVGITCEKHKNIVSGKIGELQKLGKVPVEVNDAPGFVANRILMPMINEAIYTLHEKISSVVKTNIGWLGPKNP